MTSIISKKMALFTEDLPPTKILNSFNKKGLTIIEIIVATLIIVALSGGLFGAFYGAQRILNRARHRVQAYNFATEVLDKLRGNYQWTNMISGNHKASDIGINVSGEMSNLITNPDTDFTYNVNGADNDGYKTVAVTLRWHETTTPE